MPHLLETLGTNAHQAMHARCWTVSTDTWTRDLWNYAIAVYNCYANTTYTAVVLLSTSPCSYLSSRTMLHVLT